MGIRCVSALPSASSSSTLLMNSSGDSLHKRGYRVANTEAPINEALAAGMLLTAGWHGQSDFYDPMCGSGTLLIEAALIALNIAPGVFRKSFAFEKWPDFNPDLFEAVSSDDSQEREFAHHIYGSDASFYAVQAALKNIRSAGLTRYIDVKQIRLQELRKNPAEAAGALLVAAGLLLGTQFPIVKKIWSSSMTLYSGGLCFLLTAATYYIVDVKHWRKGLSWLKIYGMNAIGAYCAGELLRYDTLPQAIGNALLVFFLLLLMYKNKIFLKV